MDFIALDWAMRISMAGNPVVVLSGEGAGLGRRAEARGLLRSGADLPGGRHHHRQRTLPQARVTRDAPDAVLSGAEG